MRIRWTQSGKRGLGLNKGRGNWKQGGRARGAQTKTQPCAQAQDKQRNIKQRQHRALTIIAMISPHSRETGKHLHR